VHLRASNTEPIIRVIAEAADAAEAAALASSVAEIAFGQEVHPL
jgi:phosphomannomutase